jgi:hypothetical protein
VPEHGVPEAVEVCEGGGIAPVDIRIEGSASGPYPGTFVETGTVMIGPRTRVTTNSVGVEIGAGRVLGIHAIFHIQSGDTSIDGEKWLIAPSGLLAGCDTFVNAPSRTNVGWRFTGFTLQFEGPSCVPEPRSPPLMEPGSAEGQRPCRCSPSTK